MSCDFSIRHYRDILEAGLERGYQFIGYEELGALPAGQKACILRHDVDYMPEWSPRLAEIESDLDIRSTYFFQVGASTYNLREPGNCHTVSKLSEMGHTLGLHFDVSWKENVQWEEAVSLCEQDKGVFKAITGIEPCDIVSFHNPRSFAEMVFDRSIPGLHHTYESAFFSSIKYLSDSQGWYEGCMCKVFASDKYDVIQLLIHPYIWPEDTAGDFISDIARMIKLRCDELTEYLLEYHPVCKGNEERLRSELESIMGR